MLFETNFLSYFRACHTASLLTTRKVLVIGGFSDDLGNSTELYDPSTEDWSTAGSMYDGRYSHATSILTNGDILVTGGIQYSFFPIESVELYNSSSQTYISTDSMNNLLDQNTTFASTHRKIFDTNKNNVIVKN